MKSRKMIWGLKRRYFAKTSGRAYWRIVRSAGIGATPVLFYDRNAAELLRIELSKSCAFGLDDVRVERM